MVLVEFLRWERLVSWQQKWHLSLDAQQRLGGRCLFSHAKVNDYAMV